MQSIYARCGSWLKDQLRLGCCNKDLLLWIDQQKSTGLTDANLLQQVEESGRSSCGNPRLSISPRTAIVSQSGEPWIRPDF